MMEAEGLTRWFDGYKVGQEDREIRRPSVSAEFPRDPR